MTTPLCGKPNGRKRPCRMPRMAGFDGCKRHRTATPDTLAIEAAHRRMKQQRCAELHARSPWLGNAEWWLDEVDKAQRWAAEFRPDARPICWEWDASDAALDAIRAEVLEGRTRRAPAGTSTAELRRDLDWEVFVVWHRHRCAWCGTVGELEVDHDHVTKLIRGLLCGGCNFHEGHRSAWRNQRARSSYRYGAPSYGADRYRAKNPATLLGLQRNYARKNTFPQWCQLAERVPIGAAPAGFQPPPVIVPGSTVRQLVEDVAALRRADRERYEMETGVLAMQECLGRGRCTTCRPWYSRNDFRELEPIVSWVRSSFPGVHERVAQRCLDSWNQMFGAKYPSAAS